MLSALFLVCGVLPSVIPPLFTEYLVNVQALIGVLNKFPTAIAPEGERQALATHCDDFRGQWGLEG